MNDSAITPRIPPSVAVGIGAWVAYWIVVYGLQASTGIAYGDWFASANNAVRTAVIPLAVGCILLAVLAHWLRWSHLWSDPVRLPTTGVMKVAMACFAIAVALRLAGTQWGRVPMDLFAAIVATGVLVGFAEETLFRVIFLRGMRAGGRSEASAALWTAACFGLFHLPNVFMGTGAIGLLQIVLAALTGSLLYVFRRHFGVIWPAMVAHGMWDISTFLGRYAAPWLEALVLPSLLLFAALGAAVLVSVWRRDRATVLFPNA